jgi:AGZA family xanthine/uracil permease-like MFS transporter
VTGILFLAALFMAPLIGMIGQYPPITAPALVIVGAMMMQSVRHIDWDDASEYVAAFVTMTAIPLSFSIADGLAIGFMLYPVIKILAGQGRQISWLMYVIAGILLVYFIGVRTRVL